jgi:nucleoside-diphosphate-sugar epimerase
VARPLILLTGATGTIGSLVARKLVGCGARVRALVRDPRWVVGDEVVRRVLGRPARSLLSWITRHRTAFQPAGEVSNV